MSTREIAPLTTNIPADAEPKLHTVYTPNRIILAMKASTITGLW